MNTKTGCQSCIFALSDKDKQTGCYAGRLDKFKSKNQATMVNNHYEISRVCNLYRNKKNNDENKDETLEKSKKQTQVSFGIVLVANGNIEEVKKTISFIRNIDYDKSKIKVVVQSDLKKEMITPLVDCINELNNDGINSKSVYNLPFNDQATKDLDSFKYIKDRNYFVKINAGSILDTSLFTIINNEINEELNMVLVFEDIYNNVYISQALVNQKYLDFNDYDKMQESIVKETINTNFYKKTNEKN